nr:hypothetical transcript [Hymenolepis microstoma]
MQMTINLGKQMMKIELFIPLQSFQMKELPLLSACHTIMKVVFKGVNYPIRSWHFPICTHIHRERTRNTSCLGK